MVNRLVRLFYRIGPFTIIGGLVFLFGLALQAVLTRVLSVSDFGAYTIQLAITVGLNVALNARFTWGNRVRGVWPIVHASWSRIVLALVSLPLFWILVHRLHVDGLIANALTVVFAMTINFVVGEKVFKHKAPELPSLATHPTFTIEPERIAE